LLTLTAFGLLLDVPDSTGDVRIVRVGMLVGLGALSTAIYLAAVRLILCYAWPRCAVWVVLGVAIALRALLLTARPILSTDIYRYVWDGRMQAAGINPYRYIQAVPALASLRDPIVYPQINRADYASPIYPPIAEIVFAVVGRVSDNVTAMRLAVLGFEAVGIIFLLRLLGERILIYAWNPLALWSFANDGRVDTFAVGLLGLALLLRARRNDGWAGCGPHQVLPLGGGACLPPRWALLASGAHRARGHRVRLRALWRCRWHVLGFLPPYGQEEGIDSGHGIWLLAGLAELMPLPPAASAVYAAGVALVFLGLAVTILRQPPPESDIGALCRDTGMPGAAAMAAIIPHYHWYFAWLALPAVVAPPRRLLWPATAPLLLIEEPILGDRFFWPSLIYVPAILLLADLRLRITMQHRRGAEIGEAS
jgi:hypothetical protein